MLLFSFKMVIEECVVHFVTISLYRFNLTTVNVVVFLYVGIRRVWFVEWNRGTMSPGVERANENGEVEKRRRDRVAWCGRQVLRRPRLLLVRESPNTLPRAFICKHGVPFVHMWLYYIMRSAEALVFFFLKEIYLRWKRHRGKPCVDCDGGGRGATAWTAACVGVCRRRISARFRVFVTPP